MSGASTIVLKFGGSVLRDEGSLWEAVHEVYRWRRSGYRVVAVVSALAGTTDRLLARAHALTERPSAHTVAAIAAGGELECAALLGGLLERAGVPARTLSPAAIGLLGAGPAEHARPVSLDSEPIDSAWEDDAVAVVPGYVGVDRDGRTVVFGRGGSDLTAVFLAAELGAACRLVKDVAGLFDRDPARDPLGACRYDEASYADALATDGTILQHAAVELARERGVVVEIAALGARRATRVSAGPSRIEPRAAAPAPAAPLRLSLLGLGTVGSALFERLQGLASRFEVRHALVRDLDRPRAVRVPTGVLTTDPRVALEGVDVVVELLGGLDPSRGYVERALASGIHVVTANKALVASEGARLDLARRANGARLAHSASVAGAAPVLERIQAATQPLVEVRGVLNGTANHVLDALAADLSLELALGQARRLGFAEADAARDLNGQDAADKLAVLARTAGCSLSPRLVGRESIGSEAAVRARNARQQGRVLRQVSSLRLETGGVRGQVQLLELAGDDPLARVCGEENAVELVFRDGSRETVRGRGAGGVPTAEAVLGDLLELVRERSLEANRVR